MFDVRKVSQRKQKLAKLKEKLGPQMKRCRDKGIREKVELIYLATKLGNVEEACGRRGISRDFYYRWYGRLKKSGWKIESLQEKPRIPKRQPGRISENLERRIKRWKLKGLGSIQIQMMLKQEGISLSRSTIWHVMRGRDKTKVLTRKQRRKTHTRRYELPIPGQRLQMDVKFHRLAFGAPCFIYVAVDECSRWRFARGFPAVNQYMTIQFLDELYQKAPFPIACIQTDNGQEFTFKFMGGGAHLMDQWCQQKNIRHRLIPPGEKELNGKVERSHRIDDQGFYWRAPRKNIQRFNSALDRWMHTYNNTRPHYGLHGLTPAQKLQERLLTLPSEVVDEKLFTLKLRFLRDTPKRLASEEAQLLHDLQAELTIYNSYAGGSVS